MRFFLFRYFISRNRNPLIEYRTTLKIITRNVCKNFPLILPYFIVSYRVRSNERKSCAAPFHVILYLAAPNVAYNLVKFDAKTFVVYFIELFYYLNNKRETNTISLKKKVKSFDYFKIEQLLRSFKNINGRCSIVWTNV